MEMNLGCCCCCCCRLMMMMKWGCARLGGRGQRQWLGAPILFCFLAFHFCIRQEDFFFGFCFVCVLWVIFVALLFYWLLHSITYCLADQLGDSSVVSISAGSCLWLAASPSKPTITFPVTRFSFGAHLHPSATVLLFLNCTTTQQSGGGGTPAVQ